MQNLINYRNQCYGLIGAEEDLEDSNKLIESKTPLLDETHETNTINTDASVRLPTANFELYTVLSYIISDVLHLSAGNMCLQYAFQEKNAIECIKIWLVLAQVWGEISDQNGKSVNSVNALRVKVLKGVN